MTSLRAAFSSASSGILSMPDSQIWEEATEVAVTLSPTPLERQPSAYVQTSWQQKSYGLKGSVNVTALHNSDAMAIRLAWREDRPNRSINDINVYADACAILYPENGAGADIETMGSIESPVVGWHWRAGMQEAFEFRATGIGTVERTPTHQVQARARWSADQWQVVLMRPLTVSAPRFEGKVQIGFALWAGANAERAGIKSFTPIFHDLVLDGQT
jgi:steroid C-25 hydroxylase gamma subunit